MGKRHLCTALATAWAVSFLIAGTASAQVRFSADFEQGALGEVIMVDSVDFVVAPGDTTQCLSYVVKGHFDPINPVDTSLAANANWYCFDMTGVKDKFIYLTFPDNGVHGTSCSYDGGRTWSHLPEIESGWHKVGKRFREDTVRIALFIPYTYSYHQQRVAQWGSRPNVSVDTIGWSADGRPMQLLHVTQGDAPDKARVWIHGRIHPSETPGSWLLDALVEKLTAENDPEAESIRRQMDFYILPFANPDGVAAGLSRSNTTGVNQEINFGRSEDSTVVEVKAIKAALERLTAERPFDILLNNHSQLADFACFWMHRGSTSSIQYQRKQWALTGLASSFNPYIRPLDMAFSHVAPRYVEGWMWDRFADRTIAITLETPYNCFSNNTAGEWSSVENLAVFGRRVLQAMAEYMGISTPGRIMVETPAKMGSGWEKLSDEVSFLGADGWRAVRSGAKVTYSLDNLEKGTYDVYRFVGGRNIAPEHGSEFRADEDPGVHGWVLLDTVEQKSDGRWRHVFRASAEGETADALLLIRR